MEDRWLRTAGGPYLMLHESLLKSWNGANEEDDEVASNAEQINYSPIVTDYDRACKVETYIGQIVVKDSVGVVLGGEPMRCKIYHDSDCTYIIRILYSQSEDLKEIINQSDLLTPREQMSVSLLQGQHRIFDAAVGGDEADESLSLTLQGGDYELTSCVLFKLNDYYIVVCRLKLTQGL